jgi:hypothetical protein
MFTLINLGIFVAVANVLISKKKIDLVVFCFIQIRSQNTNMEDNQDNLACTPLEIREIAKNTLRVVLLTSQDQPKIKFVAPLTFFTLVVLTTRERTRTYTIHNFSLVSGLPTSSNGVLFYFLYFHLSSA